ncbi:hypothetical protein [Sphingomonas sp. BAUL-RG-20F-R05-02]|uniref:hypothetical protein n=1 Tax=Sphingomonas sp. BAUL-RG-20F-R05-02 TaxID=2914830 RepID=UPI001F57F2A9|nr:hypothetical protein [Sphingomonas sp. BAUL-RG-20F-R05-02]
MLHKRGLFLSFEDLQERLVEAMRICWRHPDRERGWQFVRSAWPEAMQEPEDYNARVAIEDYEPIRTAALTRADVGAMEEAFGWLDHVKPADRKLIGVAVTALARGDTRVPWGELTGPDGSLSGSADYARIRYGRAMSRLCDRLNRGAVVRRA